MRAQASMSDGNQIDVEITFVVVCLSHKSGLGPFDAVEDAARTAAEIVSESPECQIDVVPVLPPDSKEHEEPAYMRKGYL